jgi:hypothetical protein
MDDLLVALGNIILLLLVEGIHDEAVIWVAFFPYVITIINMITFFVKILRVG